MDQEGLRPCTLKAVIVQRNGIYNKNIQISLSLVTGSKAIVNTLLKLAIFDFMNSSKAMR